MPVALEPLTLEHFTEWAGALILDNGEPFELEPFQRAFIGDVLAGHKAVWLVVPEGSGKTTLVAALALYWGEHTMTPSIPIGASSREQAEILYRQAEGFVTRGEMTDRFRCYDGYRRIKCLTTNGRIQVHAADDRTGDGVIPSAAILDELHRHRDLRLYRTWRGKLQKREGQIIAISTAGEPASEFEAVRQKIIADAPADKLQIDGPHVRAESGGMVLHDWAVRDERQAEEMDVVAAANPRRIITAEVLADKRADPAMTPAHWLRFTCNIPASMDGGPWLPMGAWGACEQSGVKIPEGAPVWGGIDLGMKHDTAALVWVWEQGEDRYAVEADVIEPPSDGSPLDVAVLEQKVREASLRFDVHGIAYDPWRFERSAQILGDEGFLMVEHPMTNARMAPASEQLYEAIIARRVAHNGNETFAAHVNAGVPTETERGWRLTKRKAKDKIDALIALVIAYDLAVRQVEEPPSTVTFA